MGANTMMLRSLITKRSRFPRQFVIFKSTPVFLDIVLTQTFIPDTLDSVPQAITWDITPDTTPDTALALAILADRFVILVNFLNKLDLYYIPKKKKKKKKKKYSGDTTA